MTTKRNLLAAIAAAIVLGACSSGGSDSPSPVEPPPTVKTGTATFTVASAPEGLGAVRLRVFGPGMSNPVIRGGAKVLGQQTVADTTTILLSMKSTIGAFLDISLADRTRTPTMQVLEATAGLLDGYRALLPTSVTVSTSVQ